MSRYFCCAFGISIFDTVTVSPFSVAGMTHERLVLRIRNLIDLPAGHTYVFPAGFDARETLFFVRPSCRFTTISERPVTTTANEKT